MSGPSIRAAIENVSAAISADPAKARSKNAPATARLTAGLQCELTGPHNERLITDMPPAMGKPILSNKRRAGNPNPLRGHMDARFREVVTSEAQFRAVSGNPSNRVLQKQLSALDGYCRTFIAKSPFLLISSCDADGNMDVSPKGDPGGFVRVLDDSTLAIPDRLGNRRADTFRNLLQNPHVGLLFLIPGKSETLRIGGTAMIVRDQWLRDEMAMCGKSPDFAIVISVTEAFFHCSKCVVRSKLWDSTQWPELAGLPSLAQTMVDGGKLTETVEEMQALIEKDARERLY